MSKRIYLLVLLLVTLFSGVRASHFMGGEITWQCLPNGNYRFILKAYRECNGITYNNSDVLNTNVPGLPSIQMNLWPNATAGRVDISPQCNTNPNFPHIACLPQPPTANTGAVEEWYYTSDQAYPNGVNLPAGPIPANGWTFSFTGCCRNPCTNITNASSLNWWLRAIMYPYPGQSPDDCWDNSPVFAERPSTVICSGYPFTYNPNAYDQELDSLSYTWAQPMQGDNSPITSYSPGYSYNSPLPGPTQNPNNIPATVNPYTGEVSFTSYTSGAFVTVNKVTAYKCGVKIAEIFREMQVVLVGSCGNNLPPNVTAPFQNPNTGLWTEYIDTVFAGAIVDFYLVGIDTDYLNNNIDPQTLEILASGLQFGANFTSTTTGCLNPPCATLDPPPPAQGIAATATHFVWQTDCGHLATENPCGGITNIYNFVMKVKDDFCPAPAYQWKTVTIVVKNAIMLPPRPRCISVAESGPITIDFLPADTSVIPNTWAAYYIYRSDNPAGPFDLIDSIVLDPGNNIYFHNTTSYTDNTVNGQDNIYYYYFKTRSGCYGEFYSGFSDTIQSMKVTVDNFGNGDAHITWNSIHTPLFPTSTGWFRVYRQTLAGNWIIIDSTQLLVSDNTVTGCGYIKFRIGLIDSTGCESISAIDSNLFQNALPPQLQCVAVQPNGSVTLSYLPSADTISNNYYDAYLVYASNNLTGPYTLVDSILDPSLYSYNVQGVNANQNSLYFYMVLRINCSGVFYSSASDTLRTIFLTITGTSPITSQLNWNPIRTQPLPTASNTYYIYRNYPLGTWTLLGQTTNLTATDGLNLCADSIPYRIEIYDSTGCWSVSNVSKAFYYDNVNPPIPVLDTVSIDSVTGHVFLGWIANDPETMGYIIFYKDAFGAWQILDTIWGTNNTFYEDRISPGSACDMVKQYVIAAIDSCWNTSAMGIDNIHNTLLPEITYVDPCEARITIDWNTYENMKDALAGYHVYMSENYGPFNLLGTVSSPGPGVPPPTVFVHSGYNEKSWYCYSIRAFNQDSTKTSTSCPVCIYATKPKQPKFNYLRVVSVVDNNHVLVKFHVDTSAYVTDYRIFRSTEKAGPYEIIGTMAPQASPQMEFEDYNAQVRYQSYYYYISVIDSCGLEALRSDTSRTILLQVEAYNDMTNKLIWNDYEGWTWSSVSAYNLFRGIDGLMDPIPIARLAQGTFEYLDNVSPYFETQGRFRYFIEAVEAPGSGPFVDTSYSNTAGDIQRSLIFIPNAFSPKGYNSIFRPVSAFTDKSDYLFSIYDRWGELLFETTDPEEGWDGRYEDEYVPLGVYLYYVRFITSEGQKYEKRSTVTVIK